MKPPAGGNVPRLTLAQAMGMAEAAFDRGDRAGAAQICRRILAAKADYFFALNLLGVIEAEAGQTARAAELFARAAAANPKDASAQINAGNALKQSGRPEAAVAAYDRALALDRRRADVHNNRGVALRELGRLDDALAAYDRALKCDGRFAEAWNNRGNVLRALGRSDDALAAYDRALTLRPRYSEAARSRAAMLAELGRTAEALAALDRLLEIAPDDADVHNNRGALLKDLGRLDDAHAAFDRAIALRPALAEAHNNRGAVLQDQNRIAEALASFDAAVRLKPDYANALWNRSFCRLLAGDFAQGWDGFEHRWETRSAAVQKLRLAPDWKGDRIDGSLVVLKEQGVGDEIFYASMLHDLRGYAGSITVFVDPRLVPLFRRSFDGLDIRPATELSLSMRFDAQVYLGDLGRYFRTTEAAFRDARHPYLRADPARATALRAKIADDGNLVCGLSWVSKSPVRGADKSLALADLVPLLSLPGMRFVDLQYGDTAAEQAALRADTGLGLIRVPEIDTFNDLDGLAALVEVCDVVITVSNTTAHLAAALGKPVLVMLPFAPGLLWYWHVGRADSPWYPSVELFRRKGADGWTDVVEGVRRALSARLGVRRG